MNYGIVAGLLVTLSLLLLALESRASQEGGDSRGFVLLYGLGVVFWLILGVRMNDSGLVVISCLQIFFLALFRHFEKARHD